MRWVFLIAVMLGIVWTANWSYHHLDNAILITDIWKAENTPIEWGLVNFDRPKPDVYAFTSTKGFWSIFKELWPVWTLFVLSFVVLAPLSIYIFTGLNNAQITVAKDNQGDAEAQARKAWVDARDYKEKAKAWAEEQINAAYQEQLTRVHKELEQEWDSFHKLKSQIVQRENLIQSREALAQKAQEDAKKHIVEIQKQDTLRLAHFETETAKLIKARDNAQAGYQRLKNRKTPKQKQP